MSKTPLALLVVLLSLLPALALAQDEKEESAPPPVAIGLELDAHNAVAGETITGTLTLVHSEGYATWPADASLIPEEFDVVTPLSVSLTQESAAFATLDAIEFPDTVERTTTDSLFGDTFTVRGYTGETKIPVTFTITQDTEATTLALDVRMQSFTEQSEGAFQTVEVSAALDNPNALESAAPRATIFGITMPDFTDGVTGSLLLFLAAIIGGFLLNLTPCVLPVIPLKVMTLTQHAGESKGRALFLGVMMTLGVIAFWGALGIPLAVLVGVSEKWVDPSAFLFGQWYITLGLGLVIGIMGLGIMGLFQINLPQKAYMINPSADNASGSFLFGVMAAVLGLPCFGFVVAPLLAGAASMPPLNIVGVFIGLGIGMGTPYLVFSVYPNLLSFMPKAGPASELIKQILGLMLIAGAFFFVGAGVNGVFKTYPFLKEQLVLWLITLTLVGTGFWLAWKTIKITRSAARRVIFIGLGLLIAGAPIAIAADAGMRAHSRYQNYLRGLEIQEEFGLNPYAWNKFNQAKFDAIREEPVVLVIDFTADWCINCKVLKSEVLHVKPVDPVLFGDGVFPIKADIDYPQAKAFHSELGLTGIPQLMILGPGLDEPWISSGYTSGEVLDAIERARG